MVITNILIFDIIITAVIFTLIWKWSKPFNETFILIILEQGRIVNPFYKSILKIWLPIIPFLPVITWITRAISYILFASVPSWFYPAIWVMETGLLWVAIPLLIFQPFASLLKTDINECNDDKNVFRILIIRAKSNAMKLPQKQWVKMFIHLIVIIFWITVILGIRSFIG